MRLFPSSSRSSGKPKASPTPPQPSRANATNKPFSLLLERNESSNNPNPTTLENLLQEVEESRQHLVGAPSLGAFERYKSSLRAVFKKAVPEAFSVAVEHSAINPKSMERREYRLLREVDRRLAAILRQLRSDSLRQAELASSTLTIKGLLLDAFH